NPGKKVVIIEKNKDVLGKVRVSGGGRCNVTHACFEPRDLVQFYPRGAKELLGPFTRFGPTETINWFESRGVQINRESDGRMFPVSDSSQTIIDCLLKACKQADISIWTSCGMQDFEFPKEEGGTYMLQLLDGQKIVTSKLALCTGSSQSIWNKMSEKGYKLKAPVSSLFTFNFPKDPISKLMGLSVPNANVALEGTKLSYQGPLLITHWGISGPAVLKLSAWGAEYLATCKYQCQVIVNWFPAETINSIEALFSDWLQQNLKKQAGTMVFGDFPKRLWSYFLAKSAIPEELVWAQLNKKQRIMLLEILVRSRFTMNGKTTFKEEFVTAGGIELSQIDFKNFQSKLHPGLFFGGEMLNIDGITGGFNFQAAWTAGFLIDNNA
ncbi:MAG: aminoacetone oxidase family FAD-binding enzyme, partial [Saprospiraceae bacterium]